MKNHKNKSKNNKETFNKKGRYKLYIAILAASLVLYFSLKDDFNTIVSTIFSINKIWFIVAFLFLFIYYEDI